MTLESALIVIVPEVEDLVGRFRIQQDPSAAVGVPAHVTILYPFKPPHELTEEVLRSVSELFARESRFNASLTETRRFPDVLYLAPQPDVRFRHLIAIAAARFPETPPYGGQFLEVIPHLTVAQPEDAAQLDAITAEFELAAQGRLPVQTTVSDIALIDNATGRWRVRQRFALGG